MALFFPILLSSLLPISLWPGSALTKVFDPEVFIRGGFEAEIIDYPWQVSLQGSDGHFCGGSIIGDRWILSAAHCFRKLDEDEEKNLLIVAGSTYWNEGGYIRRVQKLIRHEEFCGVPEKVRYDYALIELADPLEFSDSVKPIQLPNEDTDIADGTICYISGWGILSKSDWFAPLRLRQATAKIVNQTECKEEWGPLITSEKICARGGKFGTGACKGDSGGPLTCKIGQDSQLVGVFSFFYKNAECGESGKADVYARVSTVRDWIKSQI